MVVTDINQHLDRFEVALDGFTRMTGRVSGNFAGFLAKHRGALTGS